MPRPILLIAWLILAAVFLRPGNLFAQPWIEKVSEKDKPALSSAERIGEILASETMLSSEEKVELAGLVTEIEKKDFPAADLESIYGAFQKRITRDLDRIRDILGYLETLQNNDYLRRIGQIKAHEVKGLRDHYQALSAAFQSLGIWPVERRPSIQKCFELLSGSQGATIQNNWKQNEVVVGRYYQAWNKRYQELRKVEKSSSDGKVFPASVLGYDEKEFMKFFGDLQALLRRITPAKAGNF